MKQNQRSPLLNQQVAKAVRPQLPRDGSRDGINTHINGKMPPGFVGVWDFSGRDSKNSGTSRPGNAGKKDIY